MGERRSVTVRTHTVRSRPQNTHRFLRNALQEDVTTESLGGQRSMTVISGNTPHTSSVRLSPEGVYGGGCVCGGGTLTPHWCEILPMDRDDVKRVNVVLSAHLKSVLEWSARAGLRSFISPSMKCSVNLTLIPPKTRRLIYCSRCGSRNVQVALRRGSGNRIQLVARWKNKVLCLK